MSEHTPTPWKIDGVYIVASFGPTIADCKKSPSMEIGTARLNAAFIVKAVNSHDALVSALNQARGAISCLPMEAMGYASAAGGEQIHWPIRDELLHRIDEALASIKDGS